MRPNLISAAKVICLVALGGMLLSSLSFAQDKNGNGKPDPDATTRLRIEITGGDTPVPVEMASVYIRYVVKHSMAKDQKVEMNIKTNHGGVALAPAVQRGKVIVQVVADGWKPFGQTYDVTDDEQTIKIHLEKPPRWF